jgi:hypothetical protein
MQTIDFSPRVAIARAALCAAWEILGRRWGRNSNFMLRRGRRNLRRVLVHRCAQVLNDQVPIGSGRGLHVAMTEHALHAVGIDALAQE